ncbi:hypothetical protein C7H19_19990 [Aphanothece hegewaldii CCALA 016]|uniref:Uncharacterized protein n=1 Tax=Aphanothece hegewaldii CCALA 016 TaxID=2107694 RepID=A0A2T1LT09_9CHRO|nr:plasmid mobilization relaxosome protein MobC [Aphanothece hegewaldii]PSF33453.1 hypothetical protein C7H19_19990 [Aphanothece hegewaldii CCALA 016]
MKREKRTSRIEFRVSASEKRVLESIADQFGLSVSDTLRKLMRQLPFHQQQTFANRLLTRQIHYDLGCIGNNLNQIAKVLNTHHLLHQTLDLNTLLDLKSELASLKTMITRIQEDIAA